MSKDVTVRIIGDASRLKSAVNESENKLGKLGSVFGKVGKAMGLAAGTAGAAGLFLGVKTAAGMEQAKIAFETMLGSGKKADVFLKQLADFAAKTPFAFPELQTAASSLISAGIQANKVIPIMTTLGNVTSGMGTGSEGIRRATIALQQMSAAGRITGEDLNQLRDAGVPVFDLLAAATGKSKAEVVKLAQAGKLGSKELGQLMKALETGAGLERFSGLMDKQSRSLTGLWSTFKDTLGQGLAKLIEPAIPALKSGLGVLTQAFTVAFGSIGRAVDFLRPTFEKVVDVVMIFIDAFRGIPVATELSEGPLGRVADAGEAVRRVFGGIVAIFTDKVFPALRILAGIIRENVLPVLQGIVAFIVDRVIPPLLELGRIIIDQLVKYWQAVAKAIQDNRPQLEALMNAVKTVAGVLITILVPILKIAIPLAFAIVRTAIVLVIDVIAAFIAAIQGIARAVGGVINWVRDHWPLLTVILLGPFGIVVVQIVRHFNTIKEAVQAAFGVISRIVRAEVAVMRTILSPFIDFIKDLLRLIDKLIDAASKVGGIVGGVIGKGGGLLGKAGGVLSHVPRAAGGVFAKPHLGLVAEKGPEAIMPLGDLYNAIRGGGGNTYVTVNAPQYVGSREELGRVVQEALVRIGRRNGSALGDYA